MPLSSARNDESYGGLVSHTYEGVDRFSWHPASSARQRGGRPAGRAAGPSRTFGCPSRSGRCGWYESGPPPREQRADHGHASGLLSVPRRALDRAAVFPLVPSSIASLPLRQADVIGDSAGSRSDASERRIALPLARPRRSGRRAASCRCSSHK